MGLVLNLENTVRLYKRGNELVDLNEYVALAERNFDNWLDSANIKDKDKPAVRKAYQEMINHINNNPDQFTANLGGGFSNSFGITNSTSGFDAYGVAAGYLGKALRHMTAYTKPTATSTRLKYDKSKGLINKAMQYEIMGNDPVAFVELDDLNSEGNYNTTNRDKRIVEYLTKIRDNIDNYYDYENESDKQEIYNGLNAAIANLSNGISNDDKFTLGQLGFSNLDKYYFTKVPKSETPEQTPEQTPTQPEALPNAQEELKAKFNEWKNLNYRKSDSYESPVSLVGKPLDYLSTLPIKSAKSALLQLAIEHYLLHKSDLNYTADSNSFIRLVYNVPSNKHLKAPLNTLITAILNELVSRSAILPTDTGSTSYQLTRGPIKGTDKIYVWDSTTNQIKQVSIHSYKRGLEYVLNKFREAYGNTEDPYALYFTPSLKKGGVLKADDGVKLPTGYTDNIYDSAFWDAVDLSDDMRLRAYYKDTKTTTPEMLPRNNYSATDKIAPNNLKYDPELGGELWENTNTYKKWLDILTSNPQVAEAWARRYRALQNKDNQGISGKKYYENWFDSDDTFNFNNFKLGFSDTDSRHVYDDQVNGIGHDIYRGKVYTLNGKFYRDVPEGYSVDIEKTPVLNDDLLIYLYFLKKENDTPEQNPENQATAKKDEVAEVDTGDKKPNKLAEWSNRLLGLLPNALALSRLKLSLDYNNRIAKTVDASLVPKLHDTYELYSPVTGAFSTMQLMNLLGAEAMALANRPFTSDADRTLAGKLEASKYKDLLEQKGFIADDNEIKRTAKEALARTEDNIKRRSDLANNNRDQIIANKQAKAQLEASRLLKNYTGINNYLAENETRLRTKQLEDEALRKKFLETQGLYKIQQDYNTAMEEMQLRYKLWKLLNPNGTLSAYDAETGDYTRTKKEATRKYTEDSLKLSANIYNIPYTVQKKFTWAKNGGKLK